MRSWGKALLPFWIYLGILAVGSFLLLTFPMVLFLMLTVLIFWLAIWAVLVYLIGGSVQKRTRNRSRLGRIGTAFFCSFLTVLVLCISVMIFCWVHGDGGRAVDFFRECTGRETQIFLLVHFLVFWFGEGVEKLGDDSGNDKEKTEEEKDRGTLP